MRHSTRNLLLVACLLCTGTPSFTAAVPMKEAAEYHEVVKLVESYYHVKHKGLPVLANLGMKTAKVLSSDVRKAMRFGDFKLAIFEDQDFTTRDGFGEFHHLLRTTLEPDWGTLLAVRERDEAQTYTFVKDAGERYKVLIVVIAQHDGTVLEVDLNREEFVKLLRDPEQETKNINDEATRAANEDN
jgi:hypothetical protein